MYRRTVSIFTLLSLLLVPNVQASSRPPIKAQHGAVVTSHELASQVGLDILKAGGNAVDAAIAVGYALAVVLPTAGNIGGGGFLLVAPSDGEVRAFDFRERAPLSAHEKLFLDAQGRYSAPINHDGYLSIGVPGTVAGLFLAHERFGSLPMETLIAPAIRLAEEGFAVTWGLHADFKEFEERLKVYPETARTFFKSDGTPYMPGEILKQPDLAQSLKRIQQEGRAGFYQGRTAELLIEDISKHGGIITQKDLDSYVAIEREPVKGTYRDYEIYSMGPPSSGGTAIIEMLNILEGYDLTIMGYGSRDALHLISQAMRLAFEDRAVHLGDPDQNPEMPIERLISKPYANRLRNRIFPNKLMPSEFPNQIMHVESHSTTHISVVDKNGSAVSLTYTLEMPFGSKIIAAGTGFLLNDEMGDFNPERGRTNKDGMIGTVPNLVGPGKRMLSSMSPTIVKKGGEVFLVIGTPGGRTIINTVLQVILNVIDFGMDISEAIAAPRVHHQWFPDTLYVEKFGMSIETQRALEAIGHTIEVRNRSRSQGERGAMGILRDFSSGLWTAASDPRTPDGSVASY